MRRPNTYSPSGDSTRPPLPVWSIPLLLSVLGIILLVGNLSPLLGAVVALETVVVCGYVVWRARTTNSSQRPVTNVLALFPGHLLLLLAVSLLAAPGRLAVLWAIVPIVSLAYDFVARSVQVRWVRTSTSIGLYAILWAVLFTLLERVIAIRKGLEQGEETIAAVAFGVFGILFVSLGIYRHWRAGKE